VQKYIIKMSIYEDIKQLIRDGEWEDLRDLLIENKNTDHIGTCSCGCKELHNFKKFVKNTFGRYPAILFKIGYETGHLQSDDIEYISEMILWAQPPRDFYTDEELVPEHVYWLNVMEILDVFFKYCPNIKTWRAPDHVEYARRAFEEWHKEGEVFVPPEVKDARDLVDRSLLHYVFNNQVMNSSTIQYQQILWKMFDFGIPFGKIDCIRINDEWQSCHPIHLCIDNGFMWLLKKIYQKSPEIINKAILDYEIGLNSYVRTIEYWKSNKTPETYIIVNGDKVMTNPDRPTYYEKYHSEADANYEELSEFLRTARNAYVVEFIMKVYS
jgi:hypothetical protein